MGSRKKKRQSYEDRISQLNDDMICHILSNLSTKDVIRTSLLSTRWRNLWQCVNALDLESNKFSSFENFAGFVDEFFDFHRDLSIQKVCLTLYDHVSSSSHLKSWIDIAIKRKIQRLYIRVDCGSFGDIPLRLYTCETLVRLYLTQINLVDTEFVSLPCLKILNLKHNHYPNEDILEKLILGSPVLEDLTIIRRNHFERAKPLLVPSRTLKRIHISKTVNVVIDAPLLQCLSAEFITSKTYRIIGSCFPNKVIIDFGYYVCFLWEADALQRRRMISNVLSEFSKVKELVIGCTLKDIYPNSESRPLLAFCSLTRLSIKLFCNTDLDLLPNLLTSCPKLESLILDTFTNICYVSGKKNKEPRVTLSMATPCMVSSLKFVEFKNPIYGYDEEIELVRYFLKNSRILEKLSLRIKNNYRKKSKDRIVKELLAMPRCSSSCKLLVL